MPAPRSTAVTAALALLAATAPAHAIGFHTLGHLSGGSDWMVATAVSADGATVVGSSFNALGEEAFVWRDGVMTPLGDLPGGAHRSRAMGVSGDGAVVVGWGAAADRFEAVVWDAGGMTSLGPETPAGAGSLLRVASADGAVVAGDVTPAGGLELAFRREGGVMTPLGHPGGAWGRSSPADLTPDGSVVVGNTISEVTGQWSVFRWEAGVLETLPPPAGSALTSARAVSADGSVIVGSTAIPDTEAALWEDGLYTGLGFLPGGSVAWSEATAVSADGSRVVGNAISARGPDVFLWTRGGGMVSLLDALELGGFDLTGWSSWSATDVSADGNVVVGFGTFEGQSEGWRIVVPEPASAALLGAGLAALAARRRPAARRGAASLLRGSRGETGGRTPPVSELASEPAAPSSGRALHRRRGGPGPR